MSDTDKAMHVFINTEKPIHLFMYKNLTVAHNQVCTIRFTDDYCATSIRGQIPLKVHVDTTTKLSDGVLTRLKLQESPIPTAGDISAMNAHERVSQGMDRKMDGWMDGWIDVESKLLATLTTTSTHPCAERVGKAAAVWNTAQSVAATDSELAILARYPG